MRRLLLFRPYPLLSNRSSSFTTVLLHPLLLLNTPSLHESTVRGGCYNTDGGRFVRTTTRNRDIEEARRIVLRALRDYEADIYLFGSNVEGRCDALSDIDVGIYAHEPIPLHILSELREELENSNILPEVDIVYLNEADSHFRKKVMRTGIRWNA